MSQPAIERNGTMGSSWSIDKIQPSVEMIGPRKAEEYLRKSRGIRQRPIRERKVQRYANDMRAGKWVVSNDAISFAFNGPLMNGQHRLHAVIQADVDVPFLVVTGLPLRAYAIFDQPERRSVADYLHQWLPEEYNRNIHQLGALVRAIFRYERIGHFGSAGSWDYVDQEDVFKFALEYGSDLHEILARVSTRGARDLAATGTTLGAVYWYLSLIDPHDADEFYNRMARGVSADENDPIYVTRQTLVRYRIDPASRPKQNVMAAIIIKGWNHWRDGDRIDRIIWRGGGSRPEPFPKPR